jgi:hypothetical protein
MQHDREDTSFKRPLTNEAFRGLFRNNFKLANQAIRLAHLYVKAGHEMALGKILDEIRDNPSEDYIKTLEILEATDQNA